MNPRVGSVGCPRARGALSPLKGTFCDSGMAIQQMLEAMSCDGDYATPDLGTLHIGQAGLHTIKVRPGDAAPWRPITLRTVLFQPEEAQ